MVVLKHDKKVGSITLLLLGLSIESVKELKLKELNLDRFKWFIFVLGLRRHRKMTKLEPEFCLNQNKNPKISLQMVSEE